MNRLKWIFWVISIAIVLAGCSKEKDSLGMEAPAPDTEGSSVIEIENIPGAQAKDILESEDDLAAGLEGNPEAGEQDNPASGPENDPAAGALAESLTKEPHEDDSKVKNCVSSLISSYGDGGEVGKCLAELEALDQKSAEKWKEIIAYWDQVNEDDFVNCGKLPYNLPEDDTLCIVVLGYQLNRNGTMDSQLIERLEKALECAKQYPNAYILVTGGGTAARNPKATEADCMAKWLVEQGIPEGQIIIENRSRTTAENAEFSYRILAADYSFVTDVVIVTGDYHIPLGCILFQTEFMMREGSYMRVTAHAASRTRYSTVFDKSSQAYWMQVMYHDETTQPVVESR